MDDENGCDAGKENCLVVNLHPEDMGLFRSLRQSTGLNDEKVVRLALNMLALHLEAKCDGNQIWLVIKSGEKTGKTFRVDLLGEPAEPFKKPN